MCSTDRCIIVECCRRASIDSGGNARVKASSSMAGKSRVTRQPLARWCCTSFQSRISYAERIFSKQVLQKQLSFWSSRVSLIFIYIHVLAVSLSSSAPCRFVIIFRLATLSTKISRNQQLFVVKLPSSTSLNIAHHQHHPDYQFNHLSDRSRGVPGPPSNPSNSFGHWPSRLSSLKSWAFQTHIICLSLAPTCKKRPLSGKFLPNPLPLKTKPDTKHSPRSSLSLRRNHHLALEAPLSRGRTNVSISSLSTSAA